ncbi:MAG: murein L,D-transpeptidase [Candidatus Aminicenantes bacterium]|nr:murein L,D-transpeptidase [Candidatus Aminicenantes bacterium]
MFNLLFFLSLQSFPVNIPQSPRSERTILQLTPALTTQFTRKGLSLGDHIFIRIFKAEKVLEIWVKSGSGYKLFKKYWVCYFSGGLGTKTLEGDGKSPEGFYFVKPSQLNPWSSFFLSFNIGYPNKFDRVNGYTGGLIMVHGNCVSIGCYAMTDKRIKEIYTIIHKAFENGQPFFRIHIFPFKMTDNNMRKYRKKKWSDFWKNLKEGYDYFKKHKTPPDVSVRNKKYIFN